MSEERRYAVLIASSQYQDQRLQSLRCPEVDVDGMNEVLASKDYGNFIETYSLKNRPNHEILLKLNQVLKQAGKNDLVLIYYSGHGKLNDVGKLHLTTTNTLIDSLEATSLPLDTIKSFIDVSPANKFVLILDSCFSGAAGDAFTKGSVDDQLQLASRGRGTYVMTASTGIQVAKEKEGDQYGVFTKHIIEGIKSGDAANDEGLVTVDGLYKYVHDKVLEESSQEPMKWDINVRRDLVIAGGGRSRREEREKQIRAMLFDLASKNLLPDYVLNSALRIIKLKPQQLSDEERRLDALLDKLLKKEIELNRFLEEWGSFGREHQTIVPEKKEEVRTTPVIGVAKKISFGEFWTREKYKAIIAIYTLIIWIMFGLSMLQPWTNYNNNYIILFSSSFVISFFLGFVIAIVSYRINLRNGLYFGILLPLMWLIHVVANLQSDDILANSLVFLTAASATILLYLTLNAISSSNKLTPKIE